MGGADSPDDEAEAMLAERSLSGGSSQDPTLMIFGGVAVVIVLYYVWWFVDQTTQRAIEAKDLSSRMNEQGAKKGLLTYAANSMFGNNR